MLGRGGDVFVDSQVGEKGFDFLSAHFWGGVGVYHEIRMKRHHLACPVQEFRGDGRTGRFWRFGWALDTAAPLCYATNTCSARISVSRHDAASCLQYS